VALYDYNLIHDKLAEYGKTQNDSKIILDKGQNNYKLYKVLSDNFQE